MLDSIRRLPDLELEVMQVLWECPAPVERAQIEAVLYQRHPMAMTTLLTLLTRLSDKGFLRIEKAGRRSRYTPLVSREAYLAAQSRTFFQKLCGGSVSTFASALCEGGLSREELAQLRELLERGEL